MTSSIASFVERTIKGQPLRLVAVLGLCVSAMISAPGSAAEVSKPVKRTTFHLPPTSEAPHWNGGYLTSKAATLEEWTTYDHAGNVVSVCKLGGALPEIANMRIKYVAVTPQRGFAVAATAQAPKSGSTDTNVGLILLVNWACGITHVVRMDASAAAFLAFDSDGSLWALVRAVRVSDHAWEESSSYDLIRHYDADGRLIGTALPRSHFPPDRYPTYHAFFQVAKDRVGFFAESTNRWVEIAKTGKLLGEWSVVDSSGAKETVRNVVVTDDDQVFLAKTTQMAGQADPGLFLLDRGTGALSRVDTAAVADGQPVLLVGYDERHLLFRGASDVLYWADPKL